MFRDLLIANAAKRSWSNLGYVSSGLVAAYDGQFNAGDALHDPMATTWADLSGHGYNINLSDHSFTWDSDCLVVTDTGGVSTGVARASVSDTMKYHTVEIVMVANSGSVGQGDCAAGIWNTDRVAGSGYIGNNNSSGVQYRYQPSGTTNTNAVLSNVNTQTKAYWCGQTTSSRVYLYRRVGGSAEMSDNTSASPTNEPGGIYLLGDGVSVWWFSGKIWAVRFYNRALGATERATNYAIDARRFGL